MKKASSILGIVGGALSLFGALLFVVGGILIICLNSNGIWDIVRRFDVNMPFIGDALFDWSLDVAGVVLIIFGILKAGCGVMGLIGGVMVNKRNVNAGVLMIISAGISLLITGWLAMILFALGGIFALIKEKPPVAPIQPPVE